MGYVNQKRPLFRLTFCALFTILASVNTSAQLADNCPSYIYWGNEPSFDDNPDWSDRAQGVANDGQYWFFTRRFKLYKYERAWRPRDGRDDGQLSEMGIPGVLEDMGINHYGDLDYYRGYLFVPFEGEIIEPIPGCPFCLPIITPLAIVAVHRAADLSLVDWVDITEHQTKTGWIAINPVDGLLYTSGSKLTASDPLIRYTIDFNALEDSQQGGFLSFHDTIDIVENDGTPIEGTFTYMQGGVFSPWADLFILDGKGSERSDRTRGGIHLFRKTADGTKFRLIHDSVNRSLAPPGEPPLEVPPPPSPVLAFDYRTSSLGGQEPEGIDWWSQDNVTDSKFPGQLHAILLNQELSDDAIWWKHYTVDYFCMANLDSDGDGVSDRDEVYINNTHPLIIDSDNDFVDDRVDNCPEMANENQYDMDSDGLGDACDPDADGDGQSNADENTCGSDPLDPASLAPDKDGDMSPDCVDADDDNDGQTDADEVSCGSDPLDNTSLSPDFDGDDAPDCMDPDDDNDLVFDEDDFCPNTFIPEDRIPTSGALGRNRYALLDGDTIFDRIGEATSITTADTGGCSAEQIADELDLGNGHYRFGLSQSALQRWLDQLQ